jgi:tRNA threonylcarbamoyladenosine biosynthesis protein TsaE
LSLAAALGELLTGGETLALIGELGSGKTTFTRGLAKGLDIPDTRLVSSPTYVLEHVYPTRLPLHHYDAFRVESEEEFLALGFEEQLRQDGVLVIEWADRVYRILPQDTLEIRLSTLPSDSTGNHRRIQFSGPFCPWKECLAGLLDRFAEGRDPDRS